MERRLVFGKVTVDFASCNKRVNIASFCSFLLLSVSGYFVLMFLYKSKKTSVELIAQKVSSYFTEICR